MIEASTGFDDAALAPAARGRPGAARLRPRLPARGAGSSSRTSPAIREAQALRHLALQEDIRALHGTPLLSMSGEVIGVLSVHFARPAPAHARARSR